MGNGGRKRGNGTRKIFRKRIAMEHDLQECFGIQIMYANSIYGWIG